MRPMRVYLDTSVIGGCEDVEFIKPSRALIVMAETGAWVLLVSNLLAGKLTGAPEAVRQHLREILPAHMRQVVTGDEAVSLANCYLAAGVVDPASANDAPRGTANSIVEFSEIWILESADVDGDGLTNEQELLAGSDPFVRDSDGDTLDDGAEVQAQATSPVQRDTDGDGQDDAAELAAGTDPLVSQSRFAAAMGPVVPDASASIHWNGVAGRSYRGVRSQELGTLNMDFLKGGMEGVG